MSKTHYLKTWPEQFVAVRAQRKTFEFRQNDRDFQVGDRLVLMEFFPVTREYSGEQITVEITYVLSCGFGVPDGFAVLGIQLEALKDDAAALAEFSDYFARNYPGPDTVIHNPHWHAPKIFSAARYALRRQGAIK